MQLLLGWQPQHNHYHADFGMAWNIGSVLPAPQLLLYTAPKVFITGIRLWIFCRNQLIFFGCCPQRNELDSHIVCDWLWPNVTYKECGCSKISSHGNLSLVFLQPSLFTRCCQLCAQWRWKKYQMLLSDEIYSLISLVASIFRMKGLFFSGSLYRDSFRRDDILLLHELTSGATAFAQLPIPFVYCSREF